MEGKNIDYAGVWKAIKVDRPHLGARDFHMYWSIDSGIRQIAEESGVSAEGVRAVLGEAPDGWDPDSV